MGLFTPKSGNFAKFKQAGDRVSGTITSNPTERQMTDFRTKQPAVYEDGNPKMEVLISVKDDAGVDWTIATSGSWRMERAIGDALLLAGIASGDVEVGGRLTVEMTGTEQGKGSQPAKTFRAEYVPAAQNHTTPAAPQAPVAPQQGYADPNAGAYAAAAQAGYPDPNQGGYQQPMQQPMQQGYAQPQAQGDYMNTPNPWQ